MLSTPIIASIIDKKRLKYFNAVILSFLLSYAFLIILFNQSRPYITKEPYTMAINISDPRYKKYFINISLLVYPDYLYIFQKIGSTCMKPGIIISDNEYEYPLFKDIFNSKIKIYPAHIYVQNFSRVIPIKSAPDCIIANFGDLKQIKANKDVYVNETPFLKNLFLYVKKK
jgi:hypothetical protein